MRVVSNTSPISNLASIGLLDLLRSQLSMVLIPPAVERELAQHPDPSAREAIRIAMEQGWIRVSAPQDSPMHGILQQHLHAGEAEAIALAAESGSDLVLIDELEGRRLAAAVKLRVTGTLGILLRAKAAGEIASMSQAIGLLRLKAAFFISPWLQAKVLVEAGESE